MIPGAYGNFARCTHGACNPLLVALSYKQQRYLREAPQLADIQDWVQNRRRSEHNVLYGWRRAPEPRVPFP